VTFHEKRVKDGNRDRPQQRARISEPQEKYATPNQLRGNANADSLLLGRGWEDECVDEFSGMSLNL
jgi:hypothetical protein